MESRSKPREHGDGGSLQNTPENEGVSRRFVRGAAAGVQRPAAGVFRRRVERFAEGFYTRFVRFLRVDPDPGWDTMDPARMLSLPDVVDRLTGGLRVLPGAAAQQRMAPVPRHGWRPGLFPEDARPAAALLLFYPLDGEAAFLLTKRSAVLPTHRGQVSLPGGAVDAGETLEQAALREAFEEVGLAADGIRILGRLSAMPIPVSGFVLHPVVAATNRRPAVHVASAEVARLIEVRVSDFLDPVRHRRTTRTRDGLEFDMPYFDLDGEEVWGATAMVLAEVATLLGVPPDPR